MTVNCPLKHKHGAVSEVKIHCESQIQCRTSVALTSDDSLRTSKATLITVLTAESASVINVTFKV